MTTIGRVGVLRSLHLGSGHKVSVIWGWTIFGWAMKNATISLWGYEIYHYCFVVLLKYLAKWIL